MGSESIASGGAPDRTDQQPHRAGFAARLARVSRISRSSAATKGPCKQAQQVTTLLRVVGSFWPAMLHPFAWALKFDRFQTVRNTCQQMRTLLWDATLLRPFAWALSSF